MTGPFAYAGLDAPTRAALQMPAEALAEALGDRLEVFPTDAEMIASFAHTMLADYHAALEAGRRRAAFIVPVGPVGQYHLLADLCRAEGLSLDRLTLIVMDEYLDDTGAWIDAADPLSFRAHIDRNLVSRLPAEMRPEIVVPHPADVSRVGRVIAAHDGVDVAYAGVGITGHLAFNEPEAGRNDPNWMAARPTRVVSLLPETRLINAVTAAGGNIARIPRQAVTVGMAEILSAAQVRIYMNRAWGAAAIRRLACGPITGAFPASLVQRHPAWTLHAVDHVLAAPEPVLR